MDLTPATYEWLVQDAEPPATTLVSVRRPDCTDLSPEADRRIPLRAVGTDNGTLPWELEFECRLDNGPWESCDWPIHYLPNEESPAASTSCSSARSTVRQRRRRPRPSTAGRRGRAARRRSLRPALGEIDATTATFRFAADGRRRDVRVHARHARTFTRLQPRGQTFADVPYGAHELQVRAKGAIGVVDLEPAICEWTTGDMTPPVVTIQTAPTRSRPTRPPTFSFTSTIRPRGRSARSTARPIRASRATFTSRRSGDLVRLTPAGRTRSRSSRSSRTCSSSAEPWSRSGRSRRHGAGHDDRDAPAGAASMDVPASSPSPATSRGSTFECALDRRRLRCLRRRRARHRRSASSPASTRCSYARSTRARTSTRRPRPTRGPCRRRRRRRCCTAPAADHVRDAARPSPSRPTSRT